MEGFATVEEALEELRNGKLILVTDDEDRENEGDFICAAEFATTENINFMAMHGKGLICMPMSAEYVKKLHFPQMVENNTDNHETAFTVSVDYVETTTGISAAERSMTAMRCVAEVLLPVQMLLSSRIFRLHGFPLPHSFLQVLQNPAYISVDALLHVLSLRLHEDPS